MADNDTPNRSANQDKAEGERWKSEEGVIPHSESSTDLGYGEGDGDKVGGITNRPLDEEIENQDALPERGQSQADERSRNNEDLER
jgi:hypothetical protein